MLSNKPTTNSRFSTFLLHLLSSPLTFFSSSPLTFFSTYFLLHLLSSPLTFFSTYFLLHLLSSPLTFFSTYFLLHLLSSPLTFFSTYFLLHLLSSPLTFFFTYFLLHLLSSLLTFFFFVVHPDSNAGGPDECRSPQEVRQRSIEFFPHWCVRSLLDGSDGWNSCVAGALLSLEMCCTGTLQNGQCGAW